MLYRHQNNDARNDCGRQDCMPQGVVQDYVPGDKCNYRYRQHPGSRKQAGVSFHGAHLLAAMAELTRSMAPPLGDTAGR
jgi:hypothetical protein